MHDHRLLEINAGCCYCDPSFCGYFFQSPPLSVVAPPRIVKQLVKYQDATPLQPTRKSIQHFSRSRIYLRDFQWNAILESVHTSVSYNEYYVHVHMKKGNSLLVIQIAQRLVEPPLCS